MAMTTLEMMGFALVFTAVVTVVLTLVYSRIRQLHAAVGQGEIRQKTLETELNKLRLDLEHADRSAVQRDKQFNALRDHVDRKVTMGGSHAAYDQALRMIKRGEVASEVSDVCGLSIAETELLAKMHHSEKKIDMGRSVSAQAATRNAAGTQSANRAKQAEGLIAAFEEPVIKEPLLSPAKRKKTTLNKTIEKQISQQEQAMMSALGVSKPKVLSEIEIIVDDL